MDAVVTEVAVEGKRLIDDAWLGKISRDQAVHMFLQFGDGLIEMETAEDIVDDGLAWLDAHSHRLRILAWCAVLEFPVLGGLALLGLATGHLPAAGVALILLAALQYVHQRFAPHPVPLRRPAPR